MRTVQQRVDHYTARMQSSLIDPTLAAVQAQQQANFAAYTIEFYPYQVELRNWLNAKGVNVLQFFRYEALNGECYRVWKTFAGDTRTAEFVVIQAKYVAWGLIAADVKSMFSSVWGVSVP